MMKHLLLLCLVLPGLCALAQHKVVKYYDKDWAETSEEKASFLGEFVKSDSGYRCTTYWIKTNAIRGISTYADTVMVNAIGLQKLYYKNGILEDSTYWDNGSPVESYHYYQNKQLAAHYRSTSDNKKPIVEGFDEAGNKVDHYVFAEDATFKGGQEAWKSYIIKNVSKDFSSKRANGVETANVIIGFVIDENGSITKSKVVQASGLSYIDRDALRVIASSPQWNAAIQYNKPVKSYKIQPFTYELKPAK